MKYGTRATATPRAWGQTATVRGSFRRDACTKTNPKRTKMTE